MTQAGHVFVVGAHRTGTTLVRNILNRSEDVAICEESHFLTTQFVGYPLRRPGFRHKFAQVGDISTETGARQVVDYIYSQQISHVFGNYLNAWRWLQENVDRQEFLRDLLASDRTDQALFDLVMGFYARGKPLRGEKTPPHIYQVPTLLEWFPDAKIIHTFRDPRAIFVSVRKMVNKSHYGSRRYRLFRKSGLFFDLYLLLTVVVTWLRIAHLHHQYQQLYPDNYFLSKYEDLIQDPVTHLKRLCDFLAIDFSEVMLQQTVVNSSFVPRSDQMQGFDTAAIDRWQKHLHPAVNKWITLWGKKQLLEFGYQL